MSILDEDESNFNKDSVIYAHRSAVIKERMSDAKILVSNCHGVSCSKCIGHKYNTGHGCPVCGSTAVILGQWRNSTCKECGSITVSCGGGDVSAVGIPKIWLELRAKEDVI